LFWGVRLFEFVRFSAILESPEHIEAMAAGS
jgi:hypothetical protein